MMATDNDLRPHERVPVPLYQELGLSPIEAKRRHVASCRRTNDTKALKEQLMGEISGWIRQHHLKQAEAAGILKVSRPRVSDVVNKKVSKFTMDALIEMLSLVGKPVTLLVGEAQGNTRALGNGSS